jgi:hypothetical protein
MPALPFKRFFIPAVRLATAQGVITNLDGDGIRFEWDITRDNTNKPDAGTVTIYNLSPILTGAILEAWQALSQASGYLVEFGLGWEGVPSTIMRADVWDYVPDRRTPTDSMAIFSLGDGGKPLRDQAVGRSFSNVKIDIVLDYLVQIPPALADAGGGGLGLIYPPESAALVKKAAAELPIQSWGNIPQGANTREAIDMIMDTIGLEWRVQNGAFIALRGGVINRPPIILRPGNGLIRYERRADDGCILEALANGEIEPGSQILVQDNTGKPFGAGVFRVERTHFRGTSDAESVMGITAAKASLI